MQRFRVRNGKPSKKVFIHCGTFKTGSSSIQNFLYEKRLDLKLKGILYPKTGLMIDTDIGQRHWHLVYKFDQIEVWNKFYNKLIVEINESECNTIILSAEAWSRLSSLDSLDELSSRLRSVGFDVYGVMYIRNRFDYGRAFYREFTRRWGNTASFKYFVSQPFNKGTFDLIELVIGFKKIFNENAIFRDYENTGDVSEDFNRLVGIKNGTQGPDHKKRQNASWGPLDIELHRLKSMGVDEVRLNRVFDKFPKWINDSVIEQYPDNFFDQSHDTFKACTGFSTKRSSEILDTDENSHKHDISEISELITALIEESF